MQKYLLFTDEPPCATTVLTPHACLISLCLGMICVCLLCPHHTPKTRESQDCVSGICVDPPVETVSDTQQIKLNGNLAKTVSKLPYQSTFVFYSERRYGQFSLSAPHPAPLATVLAAPGMGIHYLMPDLAFISIASLQLCMLPLV